MEPVGELRVRRPTADVAVVELLGEYDMANAPQLEAAVKGELAEGRGVVVDLAETEFIDSSAISVMYWAHRELTAVGKQLALRINTASVVRRALEITGLTSTLPVTADLAAAIAAAAGPPEPIDKPGTPVRD